MADIKRVAARIKTSVEPVEPLSREVIEGIQERLKTMTEDAAHIWSAIYGALESTPGKGPYQQGGVGDAAIDIIRAIDEVDKKLSRVHRDLRS